jgi:hypothetical protein
MTDYVCRLRQLPTSKLVGFRAGAVVRSRSTKPSKRW